MSSRGALPPTPPMQAEPGFDGRQSPAASTSGYSVASAPGYYFSPSASAINNIEPHTQRQLVQEFPRRVSMPSNLGYTQPPYSAPQYSPNQQSYYPSPMQSNPPQSQVSGLYYQRSLPQVCTPPIVMEFSLTGSSNSLLH